MRQCVALAIVLTLLLALVSPMSVTVVADASGATGDCTWLLSDNVLTISGNGAMADYTAEQPAPWGINIPAIRIENGVTAIGDYAFANCYSLTTATIPDSVASIGKYAFYNGIDLTTVTVGTHVEYIGDYAFSGCSDLRMIDLPDSVTVIGERAFAVSGLTSIRLSSSLLSIGNYAFYYCSGLLSISIPDRHQPIRL